MDDPHKLARYTPQTHKFPKITKVKFSIFGNKKIKKHSVIDDPYGITIPETYASDGGSNRPVEGGVLDQRLGTTSNDTYCPTCNQGVEECIGHFGHIKLAQKVANIVFFDGIKNVLSTICIKCSKPLLSYNELVKIAKTKKKGKFAEVLRKSKSVKNCSNTRCNFPSGTVTHVKDHNTVEISVQLETYRGDDKDQKKEKENLKITPEMCYAILSAISDTDCQLLGLDPINSRPEEMIISTMAVPPLQVRPSAKIEGKAISDRDDDLTHQLVSIIRCNEKLRSKKEGGVDTTSSKSDMFELLMYHISIFFDNTESFSLRKAETKNGKPLKTLMSRLGGKEGRIRGNMMGKRVNYSARTVIDSDPDISIHEVGVPIRIASKLSYPEIVTEDNIHYLTKLVRRGPNLYPGANDIVRVNELPNGDTNIELIDLSIGNIASRINIKPGDQVMRHLRSGDVVMFNRQPSLHKMSMMGHIVHVNESDPTQSTFRMNVNTTTPYNADYDGVY